MSPLEAKSIIEALANGIDPETGEDLSAHKIFNKPQIIRALFTASKALDYMEKRAIREKSLPDSAGNAWSDFEDSELLNEFDAGLLVKDIAAKHGRTSGAITARLIRFGRIKR